MRSNGACYSWSSQGRNGKMIWSRINRALTNLEWYIVFEFTHVEYVAEGISDHTPLLLTFPSCRRFASTFKYCDMWSKDCRHKTIVTEALMHKSVGTKMYQLTVLLRRIPRSLKQLNNSIFRDIYHQLATSKASLEAIQTQLHQNPLDI